MSTALPIVLIFGWIALLYAGYAVFYGDRSVRFKRRYFGPFVLAVAGMGIALLMLHQPWSWIASVPLSGVLVYRQIRDTRFCDTCASPIVDPRQRFCGKCGDRLPDRPRS